MLRESMARVTLNDFKALAAVLPPNERLAVGEVQDVLSAVVAVIHHGPQIVDAAKQGADEIANFFHNLAVEHAKEIGAEAPVRGAVTGADVTRVPQPGGANVDLNALADLVVQKLQAQAGGAKPPAVTPETQGAEPAPAANATDVTPAAEVDTTAEGATETGEEGII